MIQDEDAAIDPSRSSQEEPHRPGYVNVCIRRAGVDQEVTCTSSHRRGSTAVAVKLESTGLLNHEAVAHCSSDEAEESESAQWLGDQTWIVLLEFIMSIDPGFRSESPSESSSALSPLQTAEIHSAKRALRKLIPTEPQAFLSAMGFRQLLAAALMAQVRSIPAALCILQHEARSCVRNVDSDRKCDPLCWPPSP